MSRGYRAAGLAAWLACLAPGSLFASPLFELTGAVQGDGGLNARTVEAGAASTYFNPAFLADAEAGFELGVFALADEIGIRLQGRPSQSNDVPVGSVDMERPGGGRYDHYGLPTTWLEDGKPAAAGDTPLRARPRQAAGSSHNRRLYQAIGLVHKMAAGKIGVGLYALVPYSSFTGAAAFYSDEREQYFSNSLHPELYADRLTSTSLAFGLGARPSPKLALGAVLTLGLRTVAVTPTYLTDIGRFQNIMVDSNVQVSTALAPHFGAVFTPAPATRITATVHTPQKFEVTTDFSFLVSSGLEQSAILRFTHSYLPWTFATGLAHDFFRGPDGSFGVAATVVYALWSQYLDRHSERPHAAYAWSNTLSGVAGVRYRRSASRLFADFTYQPSPVPNQSGRSNYVDSDRWGASLGWDHKLSVLGGAVRFGVQLQVHRLAERETVKIPAPASADGVNRASHLVSDEVPDDAVSSGQPLAGREGLQTNNPGWPGYSVSGWIAGGGVNLTLGF